MTIKKVIVVGAGPSGLLLGILLAKQGIQVELLEATSELDKQPRAAHYAPPAVYELERAGVLDDVKARGFLPRDMSWRKIDTTFIAGLNFEDTPKEYRPYRMVVLPLDRLGEVLYEHIQRQPTAQVKWSHKVVKIGQDGDTAWAEVETPSGLQTHEAHYIIGCDGASSTVRRQLFGPEYPGVTLNTQLVATNVYYDFDKYGYWDTNFIVHPKNFYMAARLTKDGLYRVTYADIPGLSREEYIKRQPLRYQEILPGNPKPGDYRITKIGPYKMQQRCAPSFRVGRVILAADAAHLCNPFGGLGLTGGIVDVGHLFDALMEIHQGTAGDSILDEYSDARKKIWAEIIDPMSRENFRRLHDQDPDKARENDEFFKLCIQAETDKKLARDLMRGFDALRHDGKLPPKAQDIKSLL
ncbi:hypothetical protein ASPWEDRAFT_169379 [Aspergillus wentii DTO 134E9]|uniref:FAD-binding domain-containing protein n=1 Tax=Aspergillus wentii DTO 134E9 TaxID=1073089 RepID=A0A1L9RXF4_ASPWE|nr:uncharacterized protein ASPWEDRAFT_169379 [Aspergillus wentii DTO 134E9]KAI9931779.1 hypothetical protein MW887_010358 [Aspergillus wentii]OJJ39537.1 hypothetical protein ASPWEDRAFT_169379 [Aspergillus wentii DTO 134E9]